MGSELTEACRKYKTPLNDGDAVLTPAFNLSDAKAIIHAVGSNFAVTQTAFTASEMQEATEEYETFYRNSI